MLIKLTAMKKLIIAVNILLFVTLTSYGQTKPAKKVTPPLIVQTTAAKASPVKNDGTPDMRYKANREAAKTMPKLKKDGTLDRRFRRNKKQ